MVAADRPDPSPYQREATPARRPADGKKPYKSRSNDASPGGWAERTRAESIGKPGGFNSGPNPASSKPASSKPAYSKPAYGKPAYSKPGDAEPAYGKPAYAKPAYAKPAYAKAKPAFDPNDPSASRRKPETKPAFGKGPTKTGTARTGTAKTGTARTGTARTGTGKPTSRPKPKG